MATGAVKRVFNQTVKLYMERNTKLEVQRLDLKPIKQIIVAYDPWRQDCASAQQFFYNVSLDKVRETNLSASLRTEVKSDQSPPSINIHFNDGTQRIYKTDNLTLHEVLYNLNAAIHDRKNSEKS